MDNFLFIITKQNDISYRMQVVPFSTYKCLFRLWANGSTNGPFSTVVSSKPEQSNDKANISVLKRFKSLHFKVTFLDWTCNIINIDQMWGNIRYVSHRWRPKFLIEFGPKSAWNTSVPGPKCPQPRGDKLDISLTLCLYLNNNWFYDRRQKVVINGKYTYWCSWWSCKWFSTRNCSNDIFAIPYSQVKFADDTSFINVLVVLMIVHAW